MLEIPFDIRQDIRESGLPQCACRRCEPGDLNQAFSKSSASPTRTAQSRAALPIRGFVDFQDLLSIVLFSRKLPNDFSDSEWALH